MKAWQKHRVERRGRFTQMGSCLAKKRYSSRKHANDAASRIVKRLGKKQAAYGCDFCRGFHLTTDRKELRSDA